MEKRTNEVKGSGVGGDSRMADTLIKPIRCTEL